MHSCDKNLNKKLIFLNMFISMTFYKQKRRVFYSSSNAVISSYVWDIYLDEYLSLKTKLSSLLLYIYLYFIIWNERRYSVVMSSKL